jgi:hypothetical protein
MAQWRKRALPVVAIVLLSTARHTGRRRQKHLWQKDGGIACQTAIFLPQIFLPDSFLATAIFLPQIFLPDSFLARVYRSRWLLRHSLWKPFRLLVLRGRRTQGRPRRGQPWAGEFNSFRVAPDPGLLRFCSHFFTCLPLKIGRLLALETPADFE